VYCGREFIADDSFVVYLGDNILKSGIVDFVEEFKRSGADASILLSPVPDPWKYGVAVLDEQGVVVDVEEKPEHPRSDLAIIGVYMFTSEVFSIIEGLTPSGRGEFEITDAIHRLVTSPNHRVISHVVTDWWDDTGTAEAILGANHMILHDLRGQIEGVVEEGARLIGAVSIGANSVVHGDAVIRGPVIIGERCELENCYIGPYTSIGDGTIIKGGEIESSIIIGDTVIDFNEKIVDSLIGRHSRIVAKNSLPKGYQFIIGENSDIQI
jgi:glucose-1-phosphate thymidylyltransferase